ncbi:EAL domain-containing protein [Enterobacter cloacae]|uniref:EAL domain-containing protein n=1 Tax=Enterobacter cloacae TaxID=550 RepID=UPI001377B089|nr:EAL domain-containing protein [Enterobacter cloacae]MCK6709411.1 EAL domain-containing protein [Enterobacter cloacae]MCK6853891.1 EAL domain-containing protein [Enterobacter cloacae]NBG17880.1 EAL domain-containing protein [Enterobacter cloacae]WIF61036.1 EAL domain-containing protein [Enterobacter cloacae]
MNTKKVFLLSYDIYLFSGIRSFLPNLVLVDSGTFVSDSDILMPQYNSCLLIIDNRVPFCIIQKWLQRNSSQFIYVNSVVLTMSKSKCINRGCENSESVNAKVSCNSLISVLKTKLMSNVQGGAPSTLGYVDRFHLSDFEQEMIYASFTKMGLEEFCKANSLTPKSLYRYRDKITHRLSFDNFNETIIYLSRNGFLAERWGAHDNKTSQTMTEGIFDGNEANRLTLALKNDEIVPYFQPIVGSKGELHGVEVLARWPSGHNYAISQREFIPLAESSGQINDLTSYLMNKVASHLNHDITWQGQSFFVAFNVSPSNLSNPVFYWECLNFLELTESVPIKLMIEITENQTLVVTPAIKELIRSLRNRGVLFALDDFGTGYANLCCLNELELDVIKIDKIFIKGIHAEDQRLPMLESIINLAGILGLRTVAEGVEYACQREWLIAHKVDFLQGYYFMPPMALAEFHRYMQQYGSAAIGSAWRRKRLNSDPMQVERCRSL